MIKINAITVPEEAGDELARRFADEQGRLNRRVAEIADRVIVMRKGRLASEFADCAISKDRLLAAA